jgi:hypothetical protein
MYSCPRTWGKREALVLPGWKNQQHIAEVFLQLGSMWVNRGMNNLSGAKGVIKSETK